MPEYRKTKTVGVYVRHQARCPAGILRGSMPLSAVVSRAPLGFEQTGDGVVRDVPGPRRGPQLARGGAQGSGGRRRGRGGWADVPRARDEWLDGVHSGAVGRRRGRKGTGYSPTTLEGYERSLRYVLSPEFGARPAGEIDDREWQTWVDRLSREGLSRSRIANHLAVARAIYGWASRPTRRLVDRNPLAGLELPPNDEKPRTRVADADEAAALIAALDPADAVPYALAFYAGLAASRDQAARLAGR